MLFDAVDGTWKLDCELKSPSTKDAHAGHEKEGIMCFQTGSSNLDLIQSCGQKCTTVEIVMDSKVDIAFRLIASEVG